MKSSGDRYMSNVLSTYGRHFGHTCSARRYVSHVQSTRVQVLQVGIPWLAGWVQGLRSFKGVAQKSQIYACLLDESSLTVHQPASHADTLC